MGTFVTLDFSNPFHELIGEGLRFDPKRNSLRSFTT
jgi:hypothetical protein